MGTRLGTTCGFISCTYVFLGNSPVSFYVDILFDSYGNPADIDDGQLRYVHTCMSDTTRPRATKLFTPLDRHSRLYVNEIY